MPPSNEQIRRWRERRERRLRDRGDITIAGGDGQSPPFWHATGEILVTGDHQELAREVLRSRGHRPLDVEEEPDAAPGFHRYRAAGLDVAATVRELRGRRRAGGAAGLRAGPNHVLSGTVIEGTPYHHEGPLSQPLPSDDPGVELRVPDPSPASRVTVIDTGVWTASPLPSGTYDALASDLLDDFDVDDNDDLDDAVGHANFIAGVLLTHTANARLRLMRALDSFGVCTETELAAALDGLGKLDDVDVVNLSLGTFGQDDEPPVVLQDALERLLTSGDRVVVAAAGNDGRANPFWPAAFAGIGAPWSGQVISVAAHDGQAVCEWSNAGDWVRVAAHGEDVTSTYVNYKGYDSGWATWSGTSFATPRVAAAVAEAMAGHGSATRAAADVLREAEGWHLGPYPALP